MFKVKDLVYANRWVTMPDLSVVKFVNQWADVPDKYIRLFKTKEYAIGEQISIDNKVFTTKILEPKEDIQ